MNLRLLKRWDIAVLLVLCATILVVRLRTTQTRGLLHYDEAYRLLEVRGITQGLRGIPAILRGSLSVGELKYTIRAAGGLFPPESAKPTFLPILSLSALFPLRPDASGNLISLFTLLVTGWLFYRCGRALGIDSIWAAMVAMLMFLSPIYGYYAVSCYPHGLAELFFLGGLYAWLVDRPVRAGFFLGLAMTTHYALFMPIGVLSIWILFFDPKKSWMDWRRTIGFLLTMAVPAFAWQILYAGLKLGLHAHVTDVPFRTYFEQLYRQFSINTHGALGQPYSMALLLNLRVFRALILSEGVWTIFAMGLSAWVIGIHWKRLSNKAVGIFILTASTILFWLGNGYVLTRISIFFLPLLYLLILIAGPEWEGGKAIRRPIMIAGLLVCATLSFGRGVRMNRLLRSPFPQAADYLIERAYQGQVLDPDTWPVWQFYLGYRIHFRPETVADLALFRQNVLAELAEHKTGEGMPFIFIGYRGPAEKGTVTAFYHELLLRPPDRRWPIPYSKLELFRYEDRNLENPMEDLSLYWVTRKEFDEIMARIQAHDI